jgi:hypothetical protein
MQSCSTRKLTSSATWWRGAQEAARGEVPKHFFIPSAPPSIIFFRFTASFTHGILYPPGFDERLPEVVAFGGTGLRTMIMAVTGESQDKPNTLFVFFFEPSFDKQETEVKELRALKQQKGAGGMFGNIQVRTRTFRLSCELNFAYAYYRSVSDRRASRARRI